MFLLQKVHLNMTETLKAEYWNFSSIWGNNQRFFFFLSQRQRLILEGVGEGTLNKRAYRSQKAVFFF